MRYGPLFFLLGILTAILGILLGGLGLVLLWPAMNFSLLGIAYFGSKHSLLGKNRDGTLSLAQGFLFGPYLLLTWGIFYIGRLMTREAFADEVAPGLWVGRRPFARELPPSTRIVVDMTAEFPVEPSIRNHLPFVCVPVLDGAAPSASELDSLVARLRGEEGIFLHCAAGHGRSATIAAALLVDRGLASTIEEAEQSLRKKRKGIQLNAAQRAVLSEWLLRRSAAAPRQPIRS